MLRCLGHLEKCVWADTCHLFYDAELAKPSVCDLPPSKKKFHKISADDEADVDVEDNDVQPKRLFRLGACSEAIVALVEGNIVHASSARGCKLCIPLFRQKQKGKNITDSPFGVVVLEIYETLESLRVTPNLSHAGHNVREGDSSRQFTCNCGNSRVLDPSTGLLGEDVLNRLTEFVKSAQRPCFQALYKKQRARLPPPPPTSPPHLSPTETNDLDASKIEMKLLTADSAVQVYARRGRIRRMLPTYFPVVGSDKVIPSAATEECDEECEKPSEKKKKVGEKDRKKKKKKKTSGSSCKIKPTTMVDASRPQDVLAAMTSINDQWQATPSRNSWGVRSTRSAAVRVSTASKLRQKDAAARPVSFAVRKQHKRETKQQAQRGVFLSWLSKARERPVFSPAMSAIKPGPLSGQRPQKHRVDGGGRKFR